MEKTVVTYENIELSKETKEKCIQYLTDNPIRIYYDYNDTLSLEYIGKLMKSQDDYFELENEISDLNIDYISNLESRLIHGYGLII